MSDQTAGYSFFTRNRRHLRLWPGGRLQSLGLRLWAYAAIALASLGNAVSADGRKPVVMAFPDEEWARMEPKEAGFVDLAALDGIGRLMEKAKANGVLIRNGRLIAEWAVGGPTDQQFEAQSITKSFVSLMLGLALDDKLVPSLDTKVKDIFPAFEAGSHSKEITFRHLATMTSGIKPSRYQLDFPEETAPGERLNYHADQPANLARALTYLYERPLYDVLKERILDPTGAKASWPYDKAPWSPVESRAHGNVPVNCGFAFLHISAGDLARVGHLYLNKGKWKNRQLISEAYLAESWKPISQRDPRKSHQTDRYGLYWWQLTPGIWYMSGTWGQFCLVWPEQGIVITKVNKASSSVVSVRQVFELLHRAVTGKEFVPAETPKPTL